jgi:hypothetical protein
MKVADDEEPPGILDPVDLNQVVSDPCMRGSLLAFKDTLYRIIVCLRIALIA